MVSKGCVGGDEGGPEVLLCCLEIGVETIFKSDFLWEKEWIRSGREIHLFVKSDTIRRDDLEGSKILFSIRKGK